MFFFITIVRIVNARRNKWASRGFYMYIIFTLDWRRLEWVFVEVISFMCHIPL